MRKYARIWWQLAVMSFKSQANSPVSSGGYLLGKLARLAFFIIFLKAIFQHTDSLAGYTLAQTALFFMTFNIVDILAQLLFRGIYGIRGIVREGDFDYYLIQPTHLIWRVCFSTVDFLDVLTMIPVLAVTVYVMQQIPDAFSWFALAQYAFFILNGLVIAFALHLAVASLAVWTQELDNTIWIYRDLMTLGRFPADIYDRPLRWAITFGIPIAVMTTFPTKAFLGQLSASWMGVAILGSLGSLLASLAFWRFACHRYTSVSS